MDTAANEHIFTGSREYGFYFNDYIELRGFEDNQFTANDLIGYLFPNAVEELDENSMYEGNTKDHIVIAGGEIDSDQSWPGIEKVAYLIENDIEVGDDSGSSGDIHFEIQANPRTRPLSISCSHACTYQASPSWHVHASRCRGGQCHASSWRFCSRSYLSSLAVDGRLFRRSRHCCSPMAPRFYGFCTELKTLL